MNIQLKNIKHYKQLSEETNACYADVYVDGRKVGYVENSGKGEGMYPKMQDQALLRRMEQWVASLPPVRTTLWAGIEDWTTPMSLDFYLADLIEQDLVKKQAAAIFKKKICYVDSAGSLFAVTVKPEAREAILKGAPVKLREGDRILFTVEEVAAALNAQV